MKDDFIIIINGQRYKLVPINGREDNYIDYIMSVEGGYINHPLDKGGATNYGITQKTARSFGYLGDMKEIPKTVVTTIYKDIYYNKNNLHKINDESIALSIFDWCVNSGSWGTKKAQVVLNNMFSENLKIDGILGAKSLELLNKVEPGEFLTKYHQTQREFYQAIVNNRPTQKIFLNGWFNRINKKESFIKERIKNG